VRVVAFLRCCGPAVFSKWVGLLYLLGLSKRITPFLQSFRRLICWRFFRSVGQPGRVFVSVGFDAVLLSLISYLVPLAACPRIM